MDIGPGMFVFSSGLGLGLRLHRVSSVTKSSAQTQRQSECNRTTSVESGLRDKAVSPLMLLLRAAKSVGPLLLLGLARMVLTKAVDYQV
jgi:hypothetical protein